VPSLPSSQLTNPGPPQDISHPISQHQASVESATDGGPPLTDGGTPGENFFTPPSSPFKAPPPAILPAPAHRPTQPASNQHAPVESVSVGGPHPTDGGTPRENFFATPPRTPYASLDMDSSPPEDSSVTSRPAIRALDSDALLDPNDFLACAPPHPMVRGQPKDDRAYDPQDRPRSPDSLSSDEIMQILDDEVQEIAGPSAPVPVLDAVHPAVAAGPAPAPAPERPTYAQVAAAPGPQPRSPLEEFNHIRGDNPTWDLAPTEFLSDLSQCIEHPVPVLHSRLYYSLTIRNAQDQSCSNQEQ
jgi:hypothetical protein